jgi:hypothetical protein
MQFKIEEIKRPENELEENAFVLGRIKARLLPGDLTEEEWKAWWPRLTEKERDRYTVYETKNVITLAGKNNILTFLGSSSLSGVAAFAQQFSVGTGPIITVSVGDTSISSELFRAGPGSLTVAGNTVNISTFFGSSSGNGVYTNAGIWGDGTATSTLGTGTLYTHALYAFNKPNGFSLTSDYLLTLN